MAGCSPGWSVFPETSLLTGKVFIFLDSRLASEYIFSMKNFGQIGFSYPCPLFFIPKTFTKEAPL